MELLLNAALGLEHPADADAREQDYRSAPRWLDLAEGITLALPEECAQKRRRWIDAAGRRD
ncbi:MAG: hypothetical protein FJW90_00390 [Actinobacteria bacterium]|nr:hypothetical protein [Actinomycetota bacterium]